MSVIVNGILLGIALAMDAFSVSIANCLNDPEMSRAGMSQMAGTYAAFQFLMPLAGWGCVHLLFETFPLFRKAVPWIALILLCWIGIKMILERNKGPEAQVSGTLTFSVLMLQGIATSLDALSVGFTIADKGFLEAFATCLVIAAVTFAVCFLGALMGKFLGKKISGYAPLVGGLILIFIGIKIFLEGIF